MADEDYDVEEQVSHVAWLFVMTQKLRAEGIIDADQHDNLRTHIVTFSPYLYDGFKEFLTTQDRGALVSRLMSLLDTEE
jgi:hypothetical protein